MDGGSCSVRIADIQLDVPTVIVDTGNEENFLSFEAAKQLGLIVEVDALIR
jgi:hypothetical protein